MAVKNPKIKDQTQHAFKRLNNIKRWAVHNDISDAGILKDLLGLELNIRAIQRENYDNEGTEEEA